MLAILEEEFYAEKNGRLSLSNFSESSACKVWWKCKINPNHIWQARIFARNKQNQNCPFCVGRNKKVMPEDSLGYLYKELMKQWCWEKNIGLDPFEFSPGSGQYVWWECEKGHLTYTKIVQKISGGRNEQGIKCAYCTNQLVGSDNCLAFTDPEAIKKYWDFEKNTLKPEEVVRGSRQKAHFKCDVAPDHRWIVSICQKFVQDTGCPCCLGRKVVPSNCLATTHPTLIAEWSDKNILKPTEVTYATNKRVGWKCLVCQNEWECYIYGRTGGSLDLFNISQCPFCASSKGEKTIKEYFEKRKIDYKREYRIPECKDVRPLPFDFAILDKNILKALIEYQGRHHYIPLARFGGSDRLVVQQKHDEIKQNYCKINNINLLIIPYTEQKNIFNLLDNFLKGQNNGKKYD